MSPADSGSGGLIREPTGPHKLLPLWEHPFADMYAAGDGQRKRALLLAFVRAGIGAGEAVREACRDTVKKLAQASSPFIFRILEARRIQDGRLVLAGDLLEGTTVGQHLLDGALGPARTIAIMRQLCHALDTAHGVGVLHGALSLASVILGTAGGRDDAVSLTDFGLAGAITAAAMGDHEIEIQPLSPEKVAGDGPSVREDIYLLGAIGYAMLAGEPMFRGAPADVRTSHAERAPRPLDAPEELDAIVRRCVAKSPADRFATARELERALFEAQQKLRLTTAWDDLPLRADVSARGVPAEIARDPSQPDPLAAKIPSGPYSVIGAPRSPARALAESSGAVQRRDLEAATRPSATPVAVAKRETVAKPEPVAKPETAARKLPAAPALRPPVAAVPATPRASTSESSGSRSASIPPAPKIGVPPPPATPRATGHKWSPAPKPTSPSPSPSASASPDRAQRRATALGIDLSRPIRTSEGRLPLPPDAAGVRRTGAAAAEPPKETARRPTASEASAPALAVATLEPATAEAPPSATPTAAKADAKPEAKTEAKPAAAKADAKPEAKTDAKTEAKPADAKTEAKPADAEPADAEPADAKPVDAPAVTKDERDDAEAPAVVRPRARAPESRARKPVPAWMLAAGAALVIGVPLLFIAIGDDPPSPPTELAAREPAKADRSPARDPAPPPAAGGDDRTPTPTPPTPPPPTAAEDARVPPPDPAGDDDAAELVIDEGADEAAAADDGAAAADDGATAIADTPEAPAPKPSASPSPRERAAQLVASAKKAHGAGKVDRAENLYKLALAAYPRSHTAAAALGQIYFNRSQWTKSATYYGKAVTAAPGSSDYRIRLGDAHFKNGKYAEARKHYAKAKSMGNKGAAARIAKVDGKLGK